VVRMGAGTKDTIERAARARGVSMSTFVVDACEKEAKRLTKRPPSKQQSFGGVPTFFRALCATAAAGGGQGYAVAGYELARHTASLLSQNTDTDGEEKELEARLTQLEEAWRQDDEAAVVHWYAREFPRCVQLVPARRRRSFARGALNFADEH